MLPYAVSENRQWDTYRTRLKIGHSKVKHGHYMSREQPQHVNTGEDSLLTIKRILTERPSLNKRTHQFFRSANKALKYR